MCYYTTLWNLTKILPVSTASKLLPCYSMWHFITNYVKKCTYLYKLYFHIVIRFWLNNNVGILHIFFKSVLFQSGFYSFPTGPEMSE